MKRPSVSVIIPTYNREKVLRDTLADVVQLEYPEFEVLVVDQTQNHEAETEKYLQELQDRQLISWYKLKWASLPGARNYGMRRAKGDIILFIDDDVKLSKDFLANHAKNYINSPEIGAVGGRVLDPMTVESIPEELLIEYLPKEAMDAGIAWYYLDLMHTVKSQEIISVRGCNMSFRREIFTKHGLEFDERFRGSAVREESDFCLRIGKIGYKIWYDPEAVLLHLGEESGGCHDISTRTIKYQVTHYHNHFWMSFKNLTFSECLRLYVRLFDCHVLGNPPCFKSSSPVKMFVRGFFYCLGFVDAVWTVVKSLWTDEQIYSKLDPEYQ